MCQRIRAAYNRGDVEGMQAARKFKDDCQNAGGNFIERYFYGGFSAAADFGHPRPPQPHAAKDQLASLNETLQRCGFYNDTWPPQTLDLV